MAGKADLIHLDRLLQISVCVLPVNVTMPLLEDGAAVEMAVEIEVVEGLSVY